MEIYLRSKLPHDGEPVAIGQSMKPVEDICPNVSSAHPPLIYKHMFLSGLWRTRFSRSVFSAVL